MKRFFLPYPMIHRKVQWDRDDRIPWLCIHWRTANACQRVFHLDSRGGQIGKWYFRWPWRAPNKGEVLEKIRGMK